MPQGHWEGLKLSVRAPGWVGKSLSEYAGVPMGGPRCWCCTMTVTKFCKLTCIICLVKLCLIFLIFMLPFMSDSFLKPLTFWRFSTCCFHFVCNYQRTIYSWGRNINVDNKAIRQINYIVYFSDITEAALVSWCHQTYIWDIGVI